METEKKIVISAMNAEELVSSLNLKEKFRGDQIFKWIALGIDSFDKMTNLSKVLIEELKEKSCVYNTKIKNTLVDPDGTIKLQIELFDGHIIETVLLKDADDRKTACVSCQAGCAMNCAFCQTGKLGFARNLNPNEIVEQFFHLEKIVGKLDNIVFMGMGEPMTNLSAIRKAIEILSDEKGRNLSKRRITISTSGIIKGIYDLADNGPELRLAVSLTTANPDLRLSLMPVTKANPLNELKKAIKYYTEKTNSRCTLEAALLAGKNTSEESAKELAAFVNGLNVHVNLIPWNPVSGIDFEEPSRKEVDFFVSKLKKMGINVTLRTKRGRKIGGACGQLGKVINDLS